MPYLARVRDLITTQDEWRAKLPDLATGRAGTKRRRAFQKHVFLRAAWSGRAPEHLGEVSAKSEPF